MNKEAVILGGGLTGLVVADRLQDQGFAVTVIEKEENIGGMCKSKVKTSGGKKIIYDLGPHKFATNEFDALTYYLKRCNLTEKHPISGSVILKGNKLKYPPSIVEILMKMPYHGIRCGIDFMLKSFETDGNTYEKYLKKRLGSYTYNLVFRDYAEKIWGPPQALDAELARKRVMTPGLLDLIKNAITGGNNLTFKEFYYSPLGAGYLTFKIANKIEANGGKILKSSYPIKLAGNLLEVQTPEGVEKFINSTVISTIPYNDLLSIMELEGHKTRFLGFRDLNLYYFLVRRKTDEFDCWTFFPGKDVVFNRVSRNFSKLSNNFTLLCAETTRMVHINNVWADLKNSMGLTDGDLYDSWSDQIKGAYPLYTLDFKNSIENILNVVETRGRGKLFCIGRNACHNYNNMDHTIIEATDLANIIANGGGINEWISKRKSYNWKIVD